MRNTETVVLLRYYRTRAILKVFLNCFGNDIIEFSKYHVVQHNLCIDWLINLFYSIFYARRVCASKMDTHDITSMANETNYTTGMVSPFYTGTQGISNETDYTTGMITPLYIAVIFTVHIPLWILNVGGNSLVIISVYREHNLRQPTYLLIAALAIADIFLPLFAYPPSIYAVMVENQYTCSAGTRTYFFFLTYACAAASFFHIMAITFERYIGVTKPLHYRIIVTNRRIFGLSIVMWVMSFLLAFASLPIGRNIEDPLRPVCTLPEPSSLFSFLVFCCCIMGMVFISVVYIHIYLVARRHWTLMRNVRKKAAMLCNLKKVGRDESESEDDDDADLKATKTIGIIVAFFVLCYLPMSLRYLFEGIRSSMHLSRAVWIFIKRFSETFGLLNGAINPIVYSQQNSNFRQAFKNIFKAMRSAFTYQRNSDQRKDSTAFLKARTSLSTDILL